IDVWRERYRAGIGALTLTEDALDDPGRSLRTNSFELAYHNANDRPIMEALCRLFRTKAPSLTFTAPHVENWRQPANRAIRVGFLSQYLADHTVGRLYQGLIRHLDRTRFQVILIHAPGAKQDAFRTQLDMVADKSLELAPHLAQQQAQVAAQEL